MKSLLSILLILVFGGAAYADIQSPPMTNMGPTRKLGRGFSNLLYGSSEILYTMDKVNEQEGNSAAFGYGLVRGIGRTFFRFGVGLYEIITFPVPCYKGSYRQPYASNIPWTNGGYQEFPPELGWETRYTYCN